jgi:aryl-alcohol dehydrogenase-like predicted oxidoreductase
MSDKIIEWTKLGSSGLKVSKVIIGFMSYGKKSWAEWVEDDEDKIFEILKRAYDLGLRTYDTADTYSNGYSEVLLGKFLNKYKIQRDKVVIMTKVFFPTNETLDLKHGAKGPSVNDVDLHNLQGLSRKHIIAAAENSVNRLGTYIDIYQIHRYDHSTPPEETMKALNYVIEKGLTRYIGASSMRATEFAELQFIAEKNGWHKFVSMQDYYNLLYREEEREMHHFCDKTGVGVIPWSPNARGLLTRPVDQTSERHLSDPTFKLLGLDVLSTADKEIINRVGKVAKDKGISMASTATAWILSKGRIPIVGLNSVPRLEEALLSTTVSITDEEIAFLEEPYKAKNVVGFV